MFCSHCGAANPDGAEVKFCRSCGKELGQPALSPSFGQSYQAPVGQSQTIPPLPPPPMPGVGLSSNPAMAAPVYPVQAAVFPYGGFWIRFVAYFIDSIIIGLAQSIIFFMIGFVSTFSRGGGDALVGVGLLFGMAIQFLYSLILPPTLGATPGKLVLGYHIVGSDGRHIGFGTSLVRMIGQVISGVAIGLGYIWIGVDAYKQGWHDKMANTYVVRKEFVQP